MSELTRENIKDLFTSYKEGYIGLEEAIDMILMFQTENKVYLEEKEDEN